MKNLFKEKRFIYQNEGPEKVPLTTAEGGDESSTSEALHLKAINEIQKMVETLQSLKGTESGDKAVDFIGYAQGLMERLKNEEPVDEEKEMQNIQKLYDEATEVVVTEGTTVMVEDPEIYENALKGLENPKFQENIKKLGVTVKPMTTKNAFAIAFPLKDGTLFEFNVDAKSMLSYTKTKTHTSLNERILKSAWIESVHRNGDTQAPEAKEVKNKWEIAKIDNFLYRKKYESREEKALFKGLEEFRNNSAIFTIPVFNHLLAAIEKLRVIGFQRYGKDTKAMYAYMTGEIPNMIVTSLAKAKAKANEGIVIY